LTQAESVTVSADVRKLAAAYAVGFVGVAVGLAMMFGGGRQLLIGCGAMALLAAGSLAVTVSRGRPRVVITPEGFATHALFGRGSAYRWADIDGSFVVIRVGLSEATAFCLTAEARARTGKKPLPRLSGNDEGIAGVFRLTPRRLATLLNEHKQRHARTLATQRTEAPERA
jgi:hypothetical protein